MNLQQLRIFASCAHTRDLTATAQQCGVAHGTVVRNVRALELELQIKLIHLRARPLTLTMQGERLARDAEHILEIMRRGIDAIRRSEDRLAGVLRIAVSISYSHRLVFEILRDFAQRAPEVRLDLRDVPFPSHLLQIQRRELDIALLFPAWDAPSISCETLLHERVTVALPATHSLAGATEIRLNQLAKEKWLTFYKPQSGRIGLDFFQACRRVGFTPEIVQEVASPMVRLAHVELNEGVTLLPSSYDSGVRRTIKRVLIHEADLDLPSSIMWNSDDASRVTSVFLESARSTVDRIYRRTAKLIDHDFDNFCLPPMTLRLSEPTDLGDIRAPK